MCYFSGQCFGVFWFCSGCSLKRATQARFLRLLRITNASLRATSVILGSAQNLPACVALCFLKRAANPRFLRLLRVTNASLRATSVTLGSAQNLPGFSALYGNLGNLSKSGSRFSRNASLPSFPSSVV